MPIFAPPSPAAADAVAVVVGTVRTAGTRRESGTGREREGVRGEAGVRGGGESGRSGVESDLGNARS